MYDEPTIHLILKTPDLETMKGQQGQWFSRRFNMCSRALNVPERLSPLCTKGKEYAAAGSTEFFNKSLLCGLNCEANGELSVL